MQDRDWTGTAAAVTALVLTAGVWLWPSAQTPKAVLDTAHHLMAGDAERSAEDMARWRAEARRWTGPAAQVQLSAAGTAAVDAAMAPVIR